MKLDTTNKMILTIGIVLFIMSGINMCSSCSNTRKLDAMQAKQDSLTTLVDVTHAAQTREIDLRLQMLQPQIVNQFLGFFNESQYKNEINMNQDKINYLQQLLKNTQKANDTIKTGK